MKIIKLAFIDDHMNINVWHKILKYDNKEEEQEEEKKKQERNKNSKISSVFDKCFFFVSFCCSFVEIVNIYERVFFYHWINKKLNWIFIFSLLFF